MLNGEKRTTPRRNEVDTRKRTDEESTPMAPDDGASIGQISIVGTAHVSHQSVKDVQVAIQEQQPDIVAVELDDGRYRQLQGETPDDIDARSLLRGRTIFQLLAYWLLSYIQSRLGDRFDIEPGAEMRAAVETAELHGIPVALVDRDIQTTIRRFWSRMRYREKARLLWELLLAIVGLGGNGEEIAIEDLNDTDVVSALLAEFRRFSPGGAEALIDERDAFIAHRLLALAESGANVVAVVGAGHVEGIEAYLDDPASLPPMESLTDDDSGRRVSLFNVFGYLVAIVFLGFFVLLAMAGVRSPFLIKLFVAWFLFNGIFAFTMAKLAGARWPSAIVGGLVAWMTSVNPLLAPGWFAGYVELRYVSVNISEITELNEILSDEESPLRDIIDRMLAVPLFRLIAVVALTNVGSLIASILFPLIVIPWLAPEIGGVGELSTLIVKGAERSITIILESLPMVLMAS